MRAVVTAMLIVCVAFVGQSFAEEQEKYSHLKADDYNNIFVYKNFSKCVVAEKELTKSLEGVLLRSRLDAFITEGPPVRKIVSEEGEHQGKFLIHKLVKNKKIFFSAYAMCDEYRSVYIYNFELNFGIVDERFNILFYAEPCYGAIAIQTLDDLDASFRKAVEDAVADYLSANSKSDDS